jgi:hypothetical protein
MENNTIIKRKVGRPKKIININQNNKDNKNDEKKIIKEIKKIIVNFNDF